MKNQSRFPASPSSAFARALFSLRKISQLLPNRTACYAALGLLACTGIAHAAAGNNTPAPRAAEKTATAKPKVDVVFVLDSTGSMGGLIEGAKKKIWSIANTIVERQPAPEVRFGLLSYRDRGDEYVTKMFDLTDDIDEVFKNLQSFRADGGGDSPESVNQALHEAVNRMTWSTDRGATKIVFLVGDCPPHMDYQDDVKYTATCAEAARRGIIVNTVQCGSDGSTTPIWQEISRLADGAYVALEQTGGMVAMTTPVDAEIAKLSAEIGQTTIAYGEKRQQEATLAKNRIAEAAAPSVAAARAVYNSSTGGKAIQGRGDLVADLADGSVKLESVKEAELPAEMQKMTATERTAYVAKQQEKRKALNTKLETLAKQRADYIDGERKRLLKEGKGDAFDLKVGEIVNTQIGRNTEPANSGKKR